MSALIRCVNRIVHLLRNSFHQHENFPLLNMPIVLSPQNIPSKTERKSILEEIIGDGFVWGVPKKRTTIERRLQKRFGDERWRGSGGGKLIIPMNNLIICDTCGNHHESHTLCGYCYEIVKKETDLLLKKIGDDLKSDPIDKEIEIVYKDDHRHDDAKKRIVEMDHQRPAFFAKNLMSKPVSSKWIETNPIIPDESPKIKE